MASDSGFPVTMLHPQHAPAVLSNETVANNGGALAVQHGAPERFPQVIVHDARQEEMYRAKGYLRFGESQPVYDAHLEYPKILCHEGFEEAVSPTQSPVVSPSGQVSFVQIPGKPARFPYVTVQSRKEEDAWAEKGYFPAGHFDYKAYEKAVDAPGEAGDEWPKWVDGVLMEDPDKPVDESRKYPMMVYAEDGTVLGTAANGAEVEKLRARGSTRNEPVVKKQTPAYIDSDYAEFLEWKEWKAQRKAKPSAVDDLIASSTGEMGFTRAQGEAAVAAFVKLQGIVSVDAPTPVDDVREAAERPMVNVLGDTVSLPLSQVDADIDTLRKEAEDLGIDIDRRWGARTLQREIDAALSR